MSDDSNFDPFAPQEAQTLTLTPVQEMLWKRGSNKVASLADQQAFSVQLEGTLDGAALKTALESLFGFHEALRGHYTADGKGFVLEPSAVLDFVQHDLAAVAEQDKPHQIASLEVAFASRPFDLVRGPLFRACVISVTPSHSVLLLAAHRSACDGWSLDVVLADLARLYGAFTGKANLPSPPTNGFSDYHWFRQQDHFVTASKRSLAFLKTKLAGVPAASALGSGPGKSEGASVTVQSTLGSEMTHSLKHQAKAQGLSFFSLLLAAHAWVIWKTTGASDFLMGIPVAGQLDSDMEDCVGPLSNVVPIRFTLSPSLSVLDFFRTTNDAVLDARENSWVDWSEIQPGSELLIAGFTHVQKFPSQKLQFGSLKSDYHFLPRASASLGWDLLAFEGADSVQLISQGDPATATGPWLTQRHQDIAKFLAAVGQGSKATLGTLVAPAAVASSEFPLSPTQERNFFAATRGPGLPIALSLKGTLDRHRLETVLQALVDRHGILRSVLVETKEGTSARILARVKAKTEYQDLSHLKGQSTAPEWEAILSQTAALGFDVYQGPLFRFSLFRLSSDLHVLVAVFSQMVFDGTSIDIFLRELTEAYTEAENNRTWAPAPLETEYSDFVAWKLKQTQEISTIERKWWLETLGTHIPSGTLPLDRTRPTVPSYQGAVIPFEIPTNLMLSLRSVAKACGVTVQMLFLSSLFLLLHTVGRRKDCWIATPVTGRSEARFESVIGTFTNMILLRSEIDLKQSFSDYLTRVLDLCLTAYEHQEVPLDQVGFRVRRSRAGGQPPLFQVEFDFEKVDGWRQTMGSLSVAPVVVHPGSASNEMTLWMKDSGERIYGTLEYAIELFDRETVVHWLNCYQTILEQVANNSKIDLEKIAVVGGDLPMVEEKLRRALTEIPGSVLAGGFRPGMRITSPSGLPLPLGAWGDLTLDGNVVLSGIRVKTDGQFELWDEVAGDSEEAQATSRAQAIAPRDAREADILAVWEEILNQEGFGVEDNFFDLGGHSLLALRLIRAMNHRLKGGWSFRDLFVNPTVAGMSSLTPGGTQDQIPLVFPARQAGSQNPFFLASGVYTNHYFEGEGENAWVQDFLRYFSNIIGMVGKNRPVYGLRPSGIFKGEPFLPNVQAMAKQYIEEIKKIQPQGPYLIGGECLGGSVAYEIAYQLRAAGEEVQSLVLLDYFRITTKYELKYRFVEFMNRLREFRRSFGSFKTLGAWLNRRRRIHLPLTEKDRDYRVIELSGIIHENSLLHYRPKQYDGKVNLIVCEEWNAVQADLGWSKKDCPHLNITHVPGDHMTRLTIHGKVTAEALMEALA